MSQASYDAACKAFCDEVGARIRGSGMVYTELSLVTYVQARLSAAFLIGLTKHMANPAARFAVIDENDAASLERCVCEAMAEQLLESKFGPDNVITPTFVRPRL